MPRLKVVSTTPPWDKAPGPQFTAASSAVVTSPLMAAELVQCIPVLSSSDCNRCLRGAITYLPTCCEGSHGGNVVNPSCNVRYEVFPFYQIQAISSPTPTPVLAPPAPDNEEKEKIKAMVYMIKPNGRFTYENY
uniref:Gnk2-homologous domain-containing protein n=1 Tax=Fagus sylvatica TaxID=28930 RepID=A0A2N9EZD8_FAGSY